MLKLNKQVKNNLFILLVAALTTVACNSVKISKIGDYSDTHFDYFSNRSKVKIDQQTPPDASC